MSTPSPTSLPTDRPSRTTSNVAVPDVSSTLSLPLENANSDAPDNDTSVVVVPVRPLLLTCNATGVLAPLSVRPANVATPPTAAIVVLPPTLAPDPDGADTITWPPKSVLMFPNASSTATTNPNASPADTTTAAPSPPPDASLPPPPP